MPGDSRRIIYASVGLLGIGVLALTGTVAWNAYRELAAANQFVLINRMSDKLIRCAMSTAVERGFTSAALGKQRASDEMVQREIPRLRRETDAAWEEALAPARALAPKMPHDSDFERALTDTVESHQALARARQQVDATLQNKKSGIDGPGWIAVASHFIEDTSRMRLTAYATSNTPRGITQNFMMIKNSAWRMSEYAGLERGTLAFYIASRRPVPADVTDELKSDRGVVNDTLKTLRNLQHMPGISPEIRQGIAAMEREFIDRFGKTRRSVYTAIDTGEYPLSAGAWMETATIAINSIIAVEDVSSNAMKENLDKLVEDSSRQLVLYMALVAMTLVLVVAAFARVRKTANALFHEKELAEVTLHSIGDAVITTDAQGHVDYMNPIAETLTGWGITEAKGRSLNEVFCVINGLTREPQTNPAEKCLRENRIIGLENNTVLIARDGTERIIEDSAAPVRDREGKIVGAVMVFYDVTLMRNSPHLLSHQATHDALTGLVNRREFERRLTGLVESAKAKNLHHVLFYLDLDQFRVINDTCGHIAGDKLLRQLAFLLKSRVRDNDTLARLGGDEFGVLLESCPLEPALRVSQDMVRLVNEFRFVWQGTTFETGVSIGVVPISPDSGSPAELLARADSACYAAKERGRNRVHVYQPDDVEMRQRQGEMQWVTRIQRALEENRFTLYCQSILPLSPTVGKDRYCETLLRLVDEAGSIVPPMTFLPAAERYNLMPAIDRWVIRQALTTFGAHCCQHPGTSMHCFINLSGASLTDEHLAEFIREQIGLNGMRPERICFEITETAAVENLDTAVAFMTAVKRMGCRFALDDFGSGMSSFGYLKNLPVDYIKIDGSFVRNMTGSTADHAMVDAINRVGHAMGVQTIAEFVENDATLCKLRELGIDYAQGFGIARPEPMAGHLALPSADQ